MTPERIRQLIRAAREDQRQLKELTTSIDARVTELRSAIEHSFKELWQGWFGNLEVDFTTYLETGCHVPSWDPFLVVHAVGGCSPLDDKRWIVQVDSRYFKEIYPHEIEAQPAPTNKEKLENFLYFASHQLGLRVEMEPIVVKQSPDALRDMRDIQAYFAPAQVKLIRDGVILHEGWDIGDDFWIVTVDGRYHVLYEVDGCHSGAERFVPPGDEAALDKFFVFAEEDSRHNELRLKYEAEILRNWRQTQA